MPMPLISMHAEHTIDEVMMKVQGSCHCGQIAYEAEVDPEGVSLCNCTDCQTFSGSAFRVSVRTPRESFKLLSGEPKGYVKTADSGAKRLHTFCGNCGAPVYACAVTDPTFYSLRVGCLRQRADLPPRKQIWYRSAVPWAMKLDGLPQIERQ